MLLFVQSSFMVTRLSAMLQITSSRSFLVLNAGRFALWTWALPTILLLKTLWISWAIVCSRRSVRLLITRCVRCLSLSFQLPPVPTMIWCVHSARLSDTSYKNSFIKFCTDKWRYQFFFPISGTLLSARFTFIVLVRALCHNCTMFTDCLVVHYEMK